MAESTDRGDVSKVGGIESTGGDLRDKGLQHDAVGLLASVVFGVSWWSIPWGVWQWQTGEVEEASSAFGGAMTQASQVLRDECAKAGGIGVLGVEVEVHVASHHASVTLTGTAVRRVGSTRVGFEFLSDLSARDFVLLERAGRWPLGIVAGASFVVAPRRSARQWASQQTQNLELPNLTQALYLAREQAMERLQASGAGMDADGVVAVVRSIASSRSPVPAAEPVPTIVTRAMRSTRGGRWAAGRAFFAVGDDVAQEEATIPSAATTAGTRTHLMRPDPTPFTGAVSVLLILRRHRTKGR